MIDKKIDSFLTLYETMSYRQSADRLFLTQPAITQHIQALEREYGCKLFNYDRKKLTATPEAATLAEYFRHVVYNENRIKQELSQKTHSPLKIGATKTIGEYVIEDRVADYLSAGRRTLHITVDNTENLLKMLDSQQLDFAIVEGIFDRTRYDYRLYSKEKYTGLCAKSHPFAGKEVEISDIFRCNAILREEGSGTRAIIERIFNEYGCGINMFSKVVEINNFSLICHLVARNMGISFGYQCLAEKRDDLSVFYIKGHPISYEFNYVYLKNSQAYKVVDEFNLK